ncbi:MAG: T9SS type A sorting domain-containing protein [Hymenobacteraceae bacterium]|nr:T9SS type A sorting domain-containing protein [Hymenobacteraceae bacterium]
MKTGLIRLLVVLSCFYGLPAARGQPVGWQSVRGFGGYDAQAGQPNRLQGGATDAAGNQYLVGSFVGNTNFGGTTLFTAGYHDGFVAKYSPSGALQWVRALAGPLGEGFRAVCLDPAGNCYVTGEFGPQATLDGVTQLPGSGIVTAAYDAAGRLIWSDVTTANTAQTGDAYPYGIALDPAGRCYVTGMMFNITRTFGAITLAFARPAINQQSFVCCYNPRRQVAWAKATTVTDTDSYPLGIAGTANGCVVTNYYSGRAGSVLGVATDSTSYLGSSYDTDGLVIALDSLGNPRWGRAIRNPFVGGATIFLTPPIVSGAQVLLAGAADTLTTFGQLTPVITGRYGDFKTFLAGYNLTTGLLTRLDIAARGFKAPGYRTAALAIPNVVREYPNGIYLGGSFFGEVQFGGLPTRTTAVQGSSDGFVAKFDPTATTGEWVVTAATSSSSLLTDLYTTIQTLSVLPTGEVFVAGSFFEQATFGTTTLTAMSRGDLFIGRIGRVVGLPEPPPAGTALDVWPNPAREGTWVQTPLGAAGGTVALFDALGRPIRTLTLGTVPVRLNTADLPRGVYVIRVTAGGVRATRKLVVEP